MDATKAIVTVWDIDWDLNWTPAGEPRTPWDQMSIQDADAELAYLREAGETVSEAAYFAMDRDGIPMKIVLLKAKPEAHQAADLGAVYVYAG